MGRFRKNMFEYEPEELSTDDSYNIAYRKVKRIKGFYSHLKVYVIVNAIIIISTLNRDFIGNIGSWDIHTFSTAIFWGIGLAIHGLTVFGPDLFFGDNWEKKKIKEYMEKEKKNANKWE